jgi:riboflavin kinase/FMN adenylyltransferase
MKVVSGLVDKELQQAGAVALTIGAFDGVHMGHRRVIRELISEAGKLKGSTALLTFDPHPRKVLGNASEPLLLTSLEHKIQLLGELGIDYCIVMPFDEKVEREEPTDFVVRQLLGAMRLRVICVGPHFAFGRGRSGDTALLRNLGEEHGFAVRIVDGVTIDGIHVSSTTIREMVRSGELAKASRFLGRPYSIVGRVVKGKSLGKRIGIPTANLASEGEVIPPAGVYAAIVRCDRGEYKGILNIDWNNYMEVHIFDFRDTLYGEHLEITFGKCIREEKKFGSLEEMVKQIRCDVEIAKKMLHNTVL